MKQSDLGIDKDKRHDPHLTTAENRFLGILWEDHFGDQNKISGNELAVRLEYALSDKEAPEDVRGLIRTLEKEYPKYLENLKRPVRTMHNHLLKHHNNIPLYSQAGYGGGYWIGADEREGMAFYNAFKRRAITGLEKATRGRKALMIEAMSQLTFEFEDLIDQSGIVEGMKDRLSHNASVAIVDATLDKMMQDPERFAPALRIMGEKFKSVLFPKSKAAALKAKVDEMRQIVEEIGL